MRILWLSNNVLSGKDGGGSGTWLGAMAQGLLKSSEVTLGNISMGPVTKITMQNHGIVQQWVVPSERRLGHDGLPSRESVAGIIKAVEEFSPDLVHIWGTEKYWALLTARGLIKSAALLETQGLKFVWAGVYHGGLSAREQLACVGLKEILKRSTIFIEKRHYEKWGRFEKEMLLQHQHIEVQTKWVESQVRAVNQKCKLILNELFPLREPFFAASPWQFSGRPVIFTAAAYLLPFKGLHIAIRALAILKDSFPLVILRIAGEHQRKGIRQDGYVAWLHREVQRLGLESAVEWLGPLDANAIVHELQSASAMVVPSYIENCCTAMQEAMMMGTPVVATYTGGLPSIAKEEESALFFPIGDEVMCAHQLKRVLVDRDLASALSTEARKTAKERNNRQKTISRQMETYRQVIALSRQQRA